MAKSATKAEGKEAEENKPICGIIMPISAMPPDYDAAHWSDVRRVLDDAICDAGMQPQIVSDSFETDVIQRRIVHNLYTNPVVICDVSGLNPNVMFELGMRLTFKSPVIVITDSVDRIPFDTSVIEHIPYPRDLHIHKMRDFSEKLTDRIDVLRKQFESGEFKSYLEAFGTFEVFQPTTENVPADKYIVDRIEDLSRAVRSLERVSRRNNFSTGVSGQPSLVDPFAGNTIKVSMPRMEKINDLTTAIVTLPEVFSVGHSVEGNSSILKINVRNNLSSATRKRIFQLIDEASDGFFEEI